MSVFGRFEPWARFVGLLVLCFCGMSTAQADEYRRFVLDDGRRYLGKVLESAGLELTIEIPQGQVVVDLTHVIDMQPVRQLDYDNQGDWRVLLAPVTGADALQNETGRLETVIEEVLDGFSGLSAFYGAELSGRISASARSDLDNCAFDVSCIRPAAAEGAVQYAIAARLDLGGSTHARTLSLFRVTVGDESDEEPEIVLANWNGAAESNTARAAILQAIYATLGLVPDQDKIAAVRGVARQEGAPPAPPIVTDTASEPANVAPSSGAPVDETPSSVDPAETAVPSPVAVFAPTAPPPAGLADRAFMPYVPIPGFPALISGDLTGVLLSWGVVVPATAVWVFWEGSASFSRADHAALGLVGYYVATTAVNLTVGSGQSAPTVGVAPTDEGWVAGITWRR